MNQNRLGHPKSKFTITTTLLSILYICRQKNRGKQEEGIARDLVNRLQNLRKDMGLEVQDKISITVERGEELVNAALEANKEYICTETQALQLNFTDQLAVGKLLEMDDVQLRVQVEQV